MDLTAKKILYVGPLVPGTTAGHRMQALKSLGCQVRGIDITLPFHYKQSIGLVNRIGRAAFRRSDSIVDWRGVGRQIIQAARSERWDILWIDKGLLLNPSVLETFMSLQPEAKLVNYSPDDMFNPRNQTQRYLAALKYYDLFVTTKSYCVEEFRKIGAKDVFFVGNAYEPSIHHPHVLSQAEAQRWGCSVGFIGAYEAARAQSLETLARSGIDMGLFGKWQDLGGRYSNVRCHHGFFADDSYAKVICAGSIGLGYLHKGNRDLQTQRSIEIPACGVFMLAERTEEHLGLFEEGKEAEFFGSDEELVDKVTYYLKHPESRKTIAAAGRERCIRSGYSNAERLRTALHHLFQA